MPKLYILLFSALLFGCSPPEPPKPTPPPPDEEEQGTPRWIPNWSTDTLVALSAERDPATGRYITDVIFTFSQGDTSMIRYDDVEYCIWTEDTEFEADAAVYSKIKMAQTPFGPVLLGEASFAYPSKFVDPESGQWVEQDQALMLNVKPPFPPEIIGNYSTVWKSLLE